jgi:hypothetical protein
MIIIGKSRARAGQLGNYLSTEGENERVELIEIKGTVARDVRGAIAEMDAYAAGTQCEKPLYHAMINPEPPNRLTPEQRAEAVDALERKLGLGGHARVVVVHDKKDREHIHVVWSRIDLERMRAVSDSHNYRKHEEVARDLERRFGHDRVQGAHHERDGVERPDRTPSRAELRQEDRTGLTGREVRAEVTAAFQASDGAEAFRSALEDKGYLLAQGDRRDFVIVDRAGGIHSLARRIDGIRAADLREFMAPIDRDRLPSAEEARDVQIGRNDVRRELGSQDGVRHNDDRPLDDNERRAREARSARADDKIEAAYARGDDFVSQSRAAQRDFERRQDELYRRFLDGDDGHDRRPDDERRRGEQHGKSQPEYERLTSPSPSSPSSAEPGLDGEITDRMAHLLGDFHDGGRGKGLDDDGRPDRQHEAPGGGRTRSR